jgi:predicted nucleic-acid-binding protein
VFLRFFTRDDQGRYEQASDLFKKANDGFIAVVTGPRFSFEITWTLRAAYILSKEHVLDVLSAIVALRSMQLTEGDLVVEAIRLARSSGQEFADAYIAASGRKTNAKVAVFNKKNFLGSGVILYLL